MSDERLFKIERAIAGIQRDQAVTAKVLEQVVEDQKSLAARLVADEKVTKALEIAQAKASSKWAIFGTGVVLILGAIGSVVGSFILKVLGVD